MVHLGKRKIMMNKPIFVRMVILDISMTVVYEMHYNYYYGKAPHPQRTPERPGRPEVAINDVIGAPVARNACWDPWQAG